MIRQLFLAAASLAVLLSADPAVSHHSFPAHYVAEESVTVEGVVTEFLWRNPHSFVYVEVDDDSGEPRIWALEWHNTVIMTRLGFDPDILQPGDHVIASGNPSRDGASRLRMVTLERPSDGFTLSRTGGAND